MELQGKTQSLGPSEYPLRLGQVKGPLFQKHVTKPGQGLHLRQPPHHCLHIALRVVLIPCRYGMGAQEGGFQAYRVSLPKCLNDLQYLNLILKIQTVTTLYLCRGGAVEEHSIKVLLCYRYKLLLGGRPGGPDRLQDASPRREDVKVVHAP